MDTKHFAGIVLDLKVSFALITMCLALRLYVLPKAKGGDRTWDFARLCAQEAPSPFKRLLALETRIPSIMQIITAL